MSGRSLSANCTGCTTAAQTGEASLQLSVTVCVDSQRRDEREASSLRPVYRLDVAVVQAYRSPGAVKQDAYVLAARLALLSGHSTEDLRRLGRASSAQLVEAHAVAGFELMHRADAQAIPQLHG